VAHEESEKEESEPAGPDGDRRLHQRPNAATPDRQTSRELEGVAGVRSHMEYRGVGYSVVQGALPNVWKWSALVGRPAMLRMGEAETQILPETHVRAVIDRAISVDEALQSSRDKRPSEKV
jgi:hypothetical protein